MDHFDEVESMSDEQLKQLINDQATNTVLWVDFWYRELDRRQSARAAARMERLNRHMTWLTAANAVIAIVAAVAAILALVAS